MKTEISPRVVIAIIAVVVVLAAAALWKGIAGHEDKMGSMPWLNKIGGGKPPPPRPTTNP